MATTEFTDTSTRIVSTWLNAVDAVVYDILNGATTVAAAKIALGIGTTDNPTFTNLTLTGVIKIGGGSPGTGKVLTSDADGDATWQTLSVDTSTITIVDNDSTAFEVKESTNSYINIDTTNSAETITIGSTALNPVVLFPGTSRVDIGNTASSSTINITGTTHVPRLRVNEIGGTESAPLVIHRHSTSLGPVLVGARVNDETAAYTAITVGKSCLRLQGAGWSGTRYGNFGFIDIGSAATGTISDTSNPGMLRLFTTPDGSTLPTERFRVDSAGRTIIGAGPTVAKLEISDSGHTNSTPLLKVTQDDNNVYGIIIGNDTYSTSDLAGLRLSVDTSGISWITSATATGTGNPMIIGGPTNAVIWIAGGAGGSGGQVKIGDLGTGNPILVDTVLEVVNSDVSNTRLFKITQNSQSEIGMVIGNNSFSTLDTNGLRMYVTNAGVSMLHALGTGAGMQIGVTADTDAVNIDATNGGLYMGGATGSSKGTGTINATGLYVNGTAVTGNNIRSYDVVVDPGSINAGGVLDVAVTVTGVLSTDRIIVNKPSITAEVHITNVYASAANTVHIYFYNSSGSSIDPPSETYRFTAIAI